MVRKAFAAFAAVLMLTIAFAPMLGTGSEATCEDPSEGSAGGYPIDDDVEDGYGFGLLTAFAIGLLIGAVMGALTVEVASPSPAPAGNTDEIDGKFRSMEAEKVTASMDTAKNLISSVLPADTDLWAFTVNYWGRSAELAVAEYWNTDDDFDDVVNDTLTLTGMPSNISNYLYSWSEAVDEAYNNLSSQSVKWDSIYGGMGMSLEWSNGGLAATNGSDSGRISTDLLQTAVPTASKNIVYIDTDWSDADLDYRYYDTIYAFGPASEYTITNVGTGTSYTLAKGANALDSVSGQQSVGKLTSGFYRLPAGAMFAGPLSMSAGDDAAEVGGGLVASDGTSTYLTTPASDGVNVYNQSGALHSVSRTLSFEISYADANGNNATKSSAIVGDGCNIIRNYDALVRQIGHVLGQSVEYAKALWTIFDECESSSKYLSPSSIVTEIPGQSISSAEAEGIYIQAMMQIASFYEDNRGIIDGIEIVTNTESLDLYCHGDIYYNGQLWAENVVFTPYVTSKDVRLVTGTNTWSGSGMCMVWAQIEDFSRWNGSVTLTEYALMDLSDGYVLEIDGMNSKGSAVDSISLTKTTIQKYNTGSDGMDDPEDAAEMLPADVLFMIIFLELAALLVLLGFYSGMQWLTFLGAIVAIAAVLWPQVLTSICLGTFQWSDLLPGGWFL